MENINTPRASGVEFLNLSVWGQFQRGLSNLLGIPISLYDGQGSLLSSPVKLETISGLLRGFDKDAAATEVYTKAVLKAVASGDAYIYKRRNDRHIFVVPVSLGRETSVAVVGGEFSLAAADEEREFLKSLANLGLSEGELLRLERGPQKGITHENVFSVLDTVRGMAVPFLKGLYSMGVRGEFAAKTGQEGSRVFDTMERIFNSILTVSGEEEFYDKVLSESTALVGAEQGSIMVLDKASASLVVKAAKGAKKKVIENIRVKVGQGIAGSIAEKGSPLFVTDIEAEMPSRKNRPGYKTRSFMAIPLKMGSKVIGVLNITDKITGEVFSKEDLRFLLFLSNYASIVIERDTCQNLNEELRVLSVTDSLTGILNRRYFQEKLIEEVERAKRYNEYFTLFMIDIDDFKVFNDRYGHLAGDEMLKSVANAIKGAIRSIDAVARYGGEEFTVILPYTRKKDAFIIAERVRKGVEQVKLPPESFSASERVTISIGVAEFPQDARNVEELVFNADRTMYFAKTMGKNRVYVYER
ncbi:MAG: diguanylate cyclase [Deltaproteobacteria bacterium]|nr:diguanylate cyclase [Deltaproteobacteria bacterium]